MAEGATVSVLPGVSSGDVAIIPPALTRLEISRGAISAAECKIGGLRSATAAKYKALLIAQADLGTADLPDLSDEGVMALLDEIVNVAGEIPERFAPPAVRKTPTFLAEFGAAVSMQMGLLREAKHEARVAEAEEEAAARASQDAAAAAEAAATRDARAAARAKVRAARDALSRAVAELHTLYPAPGNEDADTDSQRDSLDVGPAVGTPARGPAVGAPALSAAAFPEPNALAARVLAEANALAVSRLESAVAALQSQLVLMASRKATPSLRDFSVTELLASGVSLVALKRLGFSMAELVSGGVTPQSIREMPANLVDQARCNAYSCGYSYLNLLREGGFSLPDLRALGFTCVDFLPGSPTDLKAAGLAQAEFQADLRAGGYKEAEIARLASMYGFM